MFSAVGDLYQGLQDVRPAGQDAAGGRHHFDRRAKRVGEEQHYRRRAFCARGAESRGTEGWGDGGCDLLGFRDAAGGERGRGYARARQRAGRISLPYREVSISRRISRSGETEYRINGSRARLADVRSVAGEIGLGRHSILRQGAVDSIVAGGAAACRLALEEAAGLGVFRRRRVSASRRLEKADAQLERSRQLEAELEGQLRRIEQEAKAAREYREIEARYRELSLAHLYRIATQRARRPETEVGEAIAHVATLAEREREMREDGAGGRARLRQPRRRPKANGEIGWRPWRTAPRTCGPRPCARTGPSCASRPAAGAKGRGGSPFPASGRRAGSGFAPCKAWKKGPTSSKPSVPRSGKNSNGCRRASHELGRERDGRAREDEALAGAERLRARIAGLAEREQRA